MTSRTHGVTGCTCKTWQTVIWVGTRWTDYTWLKTLLALWHLVTHTDQGHETSQTVCNGPGLTSEQQKELAFIVYAATCGKLCYEHINLIVRQQLEVRSPLLMRSPGF